MTLVFSSVLIVFSLSALPFMLVVFSKGLSVVTLVDAVVRRYKTLFKELAPTITVVVEGTNVEGNSVEVDEVVVVGLVVGTCVVEDIGTVTVVLWVTVLLSGVFGDSRTLKKNKVHSVFSHMVKLC